MALPRRKFEELITRYEMHPTFRDVYVEGSTDSALVRWFLHEAGQKNVKVYDISTVDIPSSLLEKLSLGNGERTRVITLARELETKLPEDTCQVTCIIDADFDRILDRQNQCKLLFLTDYTCMEMYLFNSRLARKWLQLEAGVDMESLSADALLDHLANILRELFLVRLANEALELHLDWVDFTGCCRVRGAKIHFCREDFLHRILNKNCAHGRRGMLTATIEEMRGKLSDDYRQNIHGHDFTCLLAFYFRKTAAKKKWLHDSSGIARSLITSLERDFIKDENLFRTLLGRVQK